MRTHSQSTIIKMSEQKKKYYIFSHPEYGEIVSCSSDLPYLYPEEKINQSAISKVCRGVRNHHKRWTVIACQLSINL